MGEAAKRREKRVSAGLVVIYQPPAHFRHIPRGACNTDTFRVCPSQSVRPNQDNACLLAFICPDGFYNTCVYRYPRATGKTGQFTPRQTHFEGDIISYGPLLAYI